MSKIKESGECYEKVIWEVNNDEFCLFFNCLKFIFDNDFGLYL